MTYKLLLTILLTYFLSTTYGQNNSKTLLFVGTYTEGKPDHGIFVYEFNSMSGQLKLMSIVDKITNPSFLSVSPNGHFLYVCTDTKLPNNGSVTAFKIDSINGKISLINKQPSGGENPVYLTVYKDNKFVVNGNYTEGNASVFTTNEDGSLNPYSQIIQFADSSINKTRQDKAHIHSTVFSPDNDFIFLPDLGSDKIRVFKFDATNSKPLISVDKYLVNTVLGSGPRHFTFHPNNKFAYCIEELSGMISAYSYDNGKLDSIQRIFSYSKTQESYASADIHISPDGLFLYASNRLFENSISIFSIEQNNGKLTLVGHQNTFGDHPRNFTIDPTGKFLLVANLATNNIIVFKRDLNTGLLTKTGIEIKVPRPSCLQMRKYGS
jgi:6-phosphogluconolactonase (cycloisomerase 2 family)